MSDSPLEKALLTPAFRWLALLCARALAKIVLSGEVGLRLLAATVVGA